MMVCYEAVKFAAIVVLVVTQDSYSCLHEDELERKVEELSEDMNILTSGIHQTSDRLSKKADLVTNEPEEDNDENQCIQYEDIPEELPVDFPRIFPLEVRRQPVPDRGLLFTLKYWSSNGKAEETWRRTDNYDKLQPEMTNTSPQVETGVFETSVLIPLSEEYEVVLTVQHSDSLDRLFARFNSSSASPATVSCIPLPMFHKEPAGDVVYQDGSDVTFTLTVPPKSRDHIGRPNLHVVTFLLDLSTGEVSNSNGMNSFGGQVEEKDNVDSREFTVRLNTSNHPISGLAAFTVFDGQTVDDDLVQILRTKVVVIRPSTQNGPYPDGFLRFLRIPMKDPSSNGVVEILCEKDGPYGCHVQCVVVGSDIVSLKMWQMNKDGTKTEVTDFASETYGGENFRGVTYKMSYRKEETNFQCEAMNSVGFTKLRNLQVGFYTRAKIDKELSWLSRINDTTIELSCVVEAEPGSTVNVTFSLTYILEVFNYYNYYGDLEPDEIEHVDGTVTARKFATVYDSSTIEESPSLSSAACDMASTAPGLAPDWDPFTDHFDFDINY